VRTWTATDNCDNMVEYVQTITITDNTAPVFFSISDAVVECDNIPAPAMPLASDNCDNDVEITYNGETMTGDGCEGQIVRTWTATDDCGNTATISQTLTLSDNTAPVFMFPLPGNATVNCEEVPEPADLTATDNCSDAVVTFNEEIVADGCPYTIIRTWTATDDCGNTTDYVQELTVNDVEPPVIGDLPATINLNCEELAAFDLVPVTDNCTDVEITFIDLAFSSTCYNTIQRTWIATDGCGNVDMAQQFIFLFDESDPELIDVPADIIVDCGAEIPAPPTVLAMDNCDSDPEVTLVETQSGTDCPYTITRTWTATDGCGNSSTQSQTITVVTNIASSEVLLDAYPNPFDDYINLSFVLPENTEGEVSFVVYNSMGQMVDVVFEGGAMGGMQYNFKHSTDNYDNGIYHVRLLFADKVHHKKIVHTN